MNSDYCVAIRTLGTAGVKFQQELNSLLKQTIKPKRILVYIAEGYPLPKETIGIEQYIRCPKGMVAQRALPFVEVDTPLCFFIDDDVFLAPDSAEKMIRCLDEMDGDCIAADTFKNQDMSIMSKIAAIITSWAVPRLNDNWAFKIGYTGTFSYNAHPQKDAYLSQNAAGPCSLWKMDSFRKIHFEDEKWMDKNGFAYGDELLYFHKLYRNGGKLLVHYNSGVVHLDAQSARSNYKSNFHRFHVRSFKWFCIWWRTQYDANDIHIFRKFFASFLFIFRCIWEFVLHSSYSLLHLSFKPLIYWIKGIKDGWFYVHSFEYKSIPNFIVQ